MTLEKLKVTQEDINSNLLEILKENTRLVNYIAGENESDLKASLEEAKPNGFISEFSNGLYMTANLLARLQENNNRLSSAIYAQPETEVCTKNYQ